MLAKHTFMEDFMSVIIDTTVLNHEANEDLFQDFDLNTIENTRNVYHNNTSVGRSRTTIYTYDSTYDQHSAPGYVTTVETVCGDEYIMGAADTLEESEALAKINLILEADLIDLGQKRINTNYKTIYFTHQLKEITIKCNSYTQLLAEILK